MRPWYYRLSHLLLPLPIRNNHHFTRKMDPWNPLTKIDIRQVSALITLAVATSPSQSNNVPISSSESVLSGADFIKELLDYGNHKRIYSVLRMQKDTFLKLCLWLKKGGHLKESRLVGVEQQVAMFLWVVNYGALTLSTCERFRISAEPLHR